MQLRCKEKGLAEGGGLLVDTVGLLFDAFGVEVDRLDGVSLFAFAYYLR